MKQQEKQNQNVILVSYESLKLDPKNALKKILTFLDIPIDEAIIEKSIISSSIKKVHQSEKEKGVSIHAFGALKRSFARSGAIGQWADYFDHKDMKRIESILSKYSVNLDEFILTSE